jgi:protease-4
VLERYGDGQTVFEVIEEIRRLQEDPTVAGIVFRNVNLDASFSDMLEIRDALQRFREAGKQVVFYYESVGNLNYALAASVADKIYLSPAGSVGLTGIGSTTPYIKNLLDRIGVEVVNVSVGEYKSAGNLFSESEMPESEREARRALLEDQSEELRRMVRDGRGDALEGSVDDIVNDGPYLIADRALDAGLVDKLVYEDQLGDELSRITPGAQIEEPRFTQEITYDWQTPNAAQVALIVASGPIQSGEIDPTVGIGSGTVKRALSKARRDGSIQGVLLRVDSGGGSVLASDVIAREVRRLASQKPVVVSMGATAASGGYYIAAPATEIVAQPVTVTGSIGTVALLPNASALSQRLGIGWEQILIGENAAFASPVEPLDEEERERIRAALESRYSSFLELVAEERGMSMDAVEEAAQGRIWSGTQAAELGLVDELGGVTEARERLSELIDTERVELVPITGRRGLFDVPPATRLMTELAPTPVPAALSESVRTIRALTGARMHYVLLDPPHLRE